MKRRKPDFEYGNLSDVGRVRKENQDYYGRYEGAFGKLIIVCDGMGGYEGGSIASRLVVDAIAEHFKALGAHYDQRFEMEQAFIRAQGSIREFVKSQPEKEGMGTTAIVLLIHNELYWFANTGDSRLYLKRSGKISQLSKDHSLVQNMIDKGILSEEEAANHPKRNIITKALGTEHFMPDIFGPFTLCKNDVFMLCSDGLYHYFSVDELSQILDKPAQEACEFFVNKANELGSDDNVTVQIVKSYCGSTEQQIEKSPDKKLYRIVLLSSLSLLLVSSLNLLQQFGCLYPKAKKNKQDNEEVKPKPVSAVSASKDTIQASVSGNIDDPRSKVSEQDSMQSLSKSRSSKIPKQKDKSKK